MDNAWRKWALLQMTKLVMDLCEAMGATRAIDIARGYAYLDNDETLADEVKNSTEEFVGPRTNCQQSRTINQH